MRWNISVKTKPCVWDALVGLGIVSAAIGVFCLFTLRQATDHLTAVIRHHGVEVERVVLSDLQEERQITLVGAYHVTVCLDAEGAWVAETDCPNRDCLHSGKIKRAGSCILCLPEEIVVELEGKADDALDAVLG